MASRRPEPGRGKDTPRKLIDFAYFVEYELAVIGNILRKYPSSYYQRVIGIDLTAGEGRNGDLPGSPLVMAQAAYEAGLPLELWCCERNPATMRKLRDEFAPRLDQLGLRGRVHFLEGDHTDTIEEVFTHYRGQLGRSFGLVYSDPNGGPLPVDVFERIAQSPALARLDFLARVNVRGGYKRLVHLHGRTVPVDIQGVEKKQGFIAPLQGDWDWTFLYFTNWDAAKELPKLGLVRLDSPAGRAILDQTLTRRERQPEIPFDAGPARGGLGPPVSEGGPLYRTYAEYLRHPRYRAIRAQVVERSGGVCERCRARPVTEVHHLRYPPWGTFDVTENLRAICHQCHCEVHGKER